MKKLLRNIILLSAAALLISACGSDDSGTNPPPASGTNYFPNGEGTYYKYAVERTDSNGTQQTGTRSTKYMGTQVFLGTTYQVQYDTVTIAGFSTNNKLYFEKTGGGVFYFADTSGLASEIPDSLLQYIQLSSNRFKMLELPFENKTWNVFKLNLVYGIFNITIIDVNASYTGKEDVTLNLLSGTVTKNAAKVKFTFKLSIPDPNNLLNTYNKTYDAFAWLVDGIGIVRWQGSAVILNTFAGSGIDFADTSRVVSQSLISYDVK